MITMESIKRKLGFDPLTYDYSIIGDGDKNPLLILSKEECEFIIEEAKKHPDEVEGKYMNA
ncbi:MAG: hypothetical protein PUE04_02200 [Lachnospira sp.]|nr:hypothetical protein [Lachnospira sp.]